MVALLAASSHPPSPGRLLIVSVGVFLVGFIFTFDVRGIATWVDLKVVSRPRGPRNFNPMRLAGAMVFTAGIIGLIDGSVHA